MALTLGITGMDSKTEAEIQAAFKAANAETGHKWTLVGDNDADYVVIDMDSLYGPMSWLRLHAAGRKVIGLTSVDRNQTDYRLPRPISGSDLAVLLSEIAGDTPAAAAPEPPPAAVVSIPAPADIPPPAEPEPEPEVIEEAPASSRDRSPSGRRSPWSNCHRIARWPAGSVPMDSSAGSACSARMARCC